MLPFTLKNEWELKKKLSEIDSGLVSEKDINGYVSVDDYLDVKDKYGEQYKGFGLLKLQNLCDKNGQINQNFDITRMIDYHVDSIHKAFPEKDKDKDYRGGNYATYEDEKPLRTYGEGVSVATSGCDAASIAYGPYSKSSTSGGQSFSATYNERSSSATAGNNSYSFTFAKESPSATSGDESPSITQRKYSSSATSGQESPSITDGFDSPSATSGNLSDSITNGRGSPSATVGGRTMSITFGDISESMVAGENSMAISYGENSHAVSAGPESSAVTFGDNSIACAIGHSSKAKSLLGNWIVLSEYKDGTNDIVDVKAKKVDGKRIKADTWYELKGGKFIICDT